MAVPKKQRTAAHPFQLARKLRLTQGSSWHHSVLLALETQREQPRAHVVVSRVSVSSFCVQSAPAAGLSAVMGAGLGQAHAVNNQTVAARFSALSRLSNARRVRISEGTGIKSLKVRSIPLLQLI